MQITNYYDGTVFDDLLLGFNQITISFFNSETDLAEANVVACTDATLAPLQEILPVLMSAAHSHVDILAFTSTCKTLCYRRWELITLHASTMSSIFATALA